MAALACSDGDERQQLLEEECRDDPALQKRVEALLQESLGLGDFMRQTTSKVDRPSTTATEDLVGQTLGAFKLLQKLGEGGGGSVYLAEQSKPVRRKVALKILKLGLDTKQVIARFEAERQTLASMDHPNIARVIEAGATKEGRPFFVMEYVAGNPVTEFCRQQKLNLPDRLHLFIRICRAIEHAHRKGVIHRDLKPSNILVRQQDGETVPKVIDFGVAKAIDPSEGSSPGLTLHDTLIGTPEYMSPEQADRNLDVDTRTDIYSLGVILYELLSGITPLGASTDKPPEAREALRILRETDPPRPSSSLAQKDSTNSSLSRLPEDLDWITMKCLEKDPARRFGSASELAGDLELFLKGDPITARPPSVTYRIQKFVSRNRIPVAAVSLFLVSLVVASVFSLLFALRASQAEETEGRLRVIAEREREQALQNAQEARLHQYVANINLAHQAVQEGHLTKALLLLEPWQDGNSGPEDPRGFEWWYLMNRCAGDPHVALPNFEGPIEALAFSPDLSRLAISAGEQIHLWSIEQRRVVASIPHPARKLAFLPGSETLLAGGSEGLAFLDTRTLEFNRPAVGSIESFDSSPDGSLLATGDREGTSLWELPGWNRVDFFPGESGPMSFSPDGRKLAITTRSGVIVRSLDDDGSHVTLEESPGFPFGDRTPHFSANGNLIYLARNDTPSDLGYSMGIWKADDGQEIGMLPKGATGGIHTGILSDGVLTKNHRYLATSSWDHSVKLWNLETGALERTLLGHQGEVWSVALADNGRLIASGGKDGEVRIWDTKKSEVSPSITGPWKPLSFSKNGQTLLAHDRRDQVARFEIPSGKKISESPVVEADRRARVSGAQEVVALAGEEGQVIVYDLEHKSEKIIETDPGRVDDLELAPDEQSLVIIKRGQGMTWLDLSDQARPIITTDLSRATFSGDGATMVGTDDNGRTIQWDVTTRREKRQFKITPQTRGAQFELSFDGNLLACTDGFMDHENDITLWDTETGNKVVTLQGHKQAIWSLAFSPDGKTLASTDGSTIRFWNLATQSELLTIRIRGAALFDLMFSPDSRKLVTGSPGFHSDARLRIIR
ncbi:MAG: protein kinase domain-containing protein [Akkermansiaceae bacterium]